MLEENCLKKNMRTPLIVTIHSGSRNMSLVTNTSALQSQQHALDVRRKLFGEEHAHNAHSYHSLKITQNKLGDYTSALQLQQYALNIRKNLLGEEHAHTAESYNSLGITQRGLGNYTSALRSK